MRLLNHWTLDSHPGIDQADAFPWYGALTTVAGRFDQNTSSQRAVDSGDHHEVGTRSISKTQLQGGFCTPGRERRVKGIPRYASDVLRAFWGRKPRFCCEIGMLWTSPTSGYL